MERAAPRADAAGPGRGDRHLRGPDGAAPPRRGRGPRLRRDAAAARRVRPALRQRPAPRRRRLAAARVPVGRSDQGPRDAVGRAGHAAHQDPLRRHHARAARGARRARRGVLRRDPARHHAPGRPAPLRPHRRHARPHAPAGRRWASPPARPAATPCATSPPARWPGSATPRPSTSRPTPRALPLPARPPRLPGLRAQVQDRLLRLRGRGLRPGDDARLRRHRPPAVVDGVERGLRDLRRRRPRHDVRTRRSSLRVHPVEELLPTARRSRASSPPRREAEPQPRAHQVPGRQARHRRVPPARRRGARAPPHDDRWTAYLPHVEDFTESPLREPRPSPRTAPATPRATPSGPAPTSTAAPAGYAVGHDRPAARRHHAPSRPAGWPTSPAGTSATPCARPSSRTSCCAG